MKKRDGTKKNGFISIHKSLTSQFFILGISITMIILLFLLITHFPQKDVVGKAYTSVVNTGGVEDTTAVENTSFGVIVRANIGMAETVGVSFTMALPLEITCASLSSANPVQL